MKHSGFCELVAYFNLEQKVSCPIMLKSFKLIFFQINAIQSSFPYFLVFGLCLMISSLSSVIIMIKVSQQHGFLWRPFAIHTYCPVFALCWWKLVFVGQCVGVQRKIFFISLSLLQQQCPVRLVHPTRIVCSKWPCCCCFKECSFLCCIAITIMISITMVLQIHMQIHKQIQADSVVSDTNWFINFWLWFMATQGERHNSY